MKPSRKRLALSMIDLALWEYKSGGGIAKDNDTLDTSLKAVLQAAVQYGGTASPKLTLKEVKQIWKENKLTLPK